MDPIPQDFKSDVPSRRQFMVLAVGFEGALLVLAWVLGLFLGLRFWEGIGLSVRGLALGIALCLPLTAGVIGAVETSWGLFAPIRRDLKLVVQLFSKCTVLDLLCISLLAGICEEALFRGFLQPYLAQYTGTIIAIAIVSLIFGALHAVSLSYAVFATLISLYLGLLLLWFDDLLVPVTVHALYDFLALLYILRIRPIRDP